MQLVSLLNFAAFFFFIFHDCLWTYTKKNTFSHQLALVSCIWGLVQSNLECFESFLQCYAWEFCQIFVLLQYCHILLGEPMSQLRLSLSFNVSIRAIICGNNYIFSFAKSYFVYWLLKKVRFFLHTFILIYSAATGAYKMSPVMHLSVIFSYLE